MVFLDFCRVFVSTTGLESFSLRPEKFSKRFSFGGGCVRFVLLCTRGIRLCDSSDGQGNAYHIAEPFAQKALGKEEKQGLGGVHVSFRPISCAEEETDTQNRQKIQGQSWVILVHTFSC